MHGAKHPLLPMLLWKVAQLNSGSGLILPYVFSKSHISSKNRNIVLIMGVMAFMIKWWEAGAWKGVYHRVMRPLMMVNNRHIRV
jgi:hypothetical protein